MGGAAKPTRAPASISVRLLSLGACTLELVPDAVKSLEGLERQSGLDIFVTPEPRGPTGDGSRQSPFRSLTEARDTVRLARRNNNLTGNATIHLAPGLYGAREGIPLQLTMEDRGSPDAWMLFKGCWGAAQEVFCHGKVPSQY